METAVRYAERGEGREEESSQVPKVEEAGLSQSLSLAPDKEAKGKRPP